MAIRGYAGKVAANGGFLAIVGGVYLSFGPGAGAVALGAYLLLLGHALQKRAGWLDDDAGDEMEVTDG